jgi:hypothetical protein
MLSMTDDELLHLSDELDDLLRTEPGIQQFGTPDGIM